MLSPWERAHLDDWVRRSYEEQIKRLKESRRGAVQRADAAWRIDDFTTALAFDDLGCRIALKVRAIETEMRSL